MRRAKSEFHLVFFVEIVTLFNSYKRMLNNSRSGIGEVLKHTTQFHNNRQFLKVQIRMKQTKKGQKQKGVPTLRLVSGLN